MAQPAQPSTQGRRCCQRGRTPAASRRLPGQRQRQAPPTRVTEQLTKNWAPFKVLRQRYAGTRFSEHRQLHLPQKHKATVADSTLCVEMNGLEEQADNAKARELFWKPLMMMIFYCSFRNKI